MEAGWKAPLKPMIGGIWEMDLSKAAITNLAILKGAPIHRLNLYGNPVSDLSPLRGMAIRELVLNDTEVTDLSPLQGMPLEMLTLVGTKVADITVLHGMSIRDLHLSNTQVTDMSPLRGMPLDRLRLGGTPVTDLSPLAEAKGLTSLTLPPNARNIEFLRVFPRLERLGFKDEAGTGYLPDKTAAEFWKEYDARKR